MAYNMFLLILHPNAFILPCNDIFQGRKPKTDEFAEALVDWWLLGESDVVVSHSSYSFAHTAALRTARPIYKALGGGQCHRLMLPSFEEDDENFPYYDYRNSD